MDPEWWTLNLRHLRGVAATAEGGSLAAASHRVHLSQPALTQGIAKLERGLGVSLFERRADGMVPTEPGRMLARRMATAEERLKEGFAAAASAQGMVPLLNMSHLRAFLAFARSGSFAGAAMAGQIAQPSVHRSVTGLEQIVGVPLYHRVGRGVRLSKAGEAAAHGIGRAVAEIQAALSEIQRALGREVGTIRIGALPLSRAALVPSAVAAFRRAHPALGIEIVDGTYPDLAARLKNAEVDFLVGALRGALLDPSFVEEPLFDDLLRIVARREHPLATLPLPDAAQLAGYPWIVGRSDTPHYRHWRAMFGDAGVLPPASPVVCGSAIAIRELLEQDDYLALLSLDQVQRPLDAGHVVQIGSPVESTRRQIGLTFLSGFRPTPFQADLIDRLRALGAERKSQK